MARPSLTAVPAQRSSLPVLQVRRRLVLGLLAGTSAIGLFSGVAWALAPEPAPVVESARDEAAVSLATIVANDFVNGRDSAVPAAAGVDPLFSRTNQGAFPDARVTFAGSTQTRYGDVQAVTTERSEFHVAVTREGVTELFELSVPMVLSSGGWVLGAAPSLSPVSAASAVDIPDYSKLFEAGGTQSDLSSLPYGAAVTEQVNRWAAAFASGGPKSPELFALTQDNDASHSYDGLGGWSAEQVVVKSFATGPNDPESAARFGSTWLTVRVALVLVPPSANGPTLSTEYDLLLQPEMNTATPPVTAWGPAGVGPTSELVNYVNSNG